VFKKVLPFILLILPILLAAQNMPFSVRSETKYSISGMVGYEKSDSVKYYQLRLLQEFNIWKIAMGLDLDFLFDNDLHLRKKDWDNVNDILGKIYYITYQKRGDPIYVHLGGLPNHTIGNGLVMLNYSNMLLYPDMRNSGLMLGGNLDLPLKPQFEIFTSNVQKNQVLAFSASCMPVPEKSVKVLDQLRAGFTIAMDTNQYGNLKYLVADSLTTIVEDLGPDTATEFSIDYTLPLLRTEKVVLGQYAEIAHIADSGTGLILPGIYSDFKFLKINLEYRIYGKKYVPAFFDHYYEEDRGVQPVDTLAAFYTKEDALDGFKAANGWYGKVQAIIGKKMKVMIAWHDMYGKDLKTGKSLWIKLWVDTQYKRLENVSISYNKINTEFMKPGSFVVPKGELDTKLTLKASKKRWYLIGKYSQQYKDKDKSGAINFLKETKHSAAVGVKYIF